MDGWINWLWGIVIDRLINILLVLCGTVINFVVGISCRVFAFFDWECVCCLLRLSPCITLWVESRSQRNPVVVRVTGEVVHNHVQVLSSVTFGLDLQRRVKIADKSQCTGRHYSVAHLLFIFSHRLVNHTGVVKVKSVRLTCCVCVCSYCLLRNAGLFLARSLLCANT